VASVVKLALSGAHINPHSPVADPNMRTKQLKCGSALYYCPDDGKRYTSQLGYFTTGSETGEAPGVNLTRSAQTECGGAHVFCPGDGIQYYVNTGFYTTGLTATTRTGRAQCGNHTYWCPGDGVRYDVSTGYITTGHNYTTRSAQEKCGAVQPTGAYHYCHGGRRYTAPRGYHTLGGPGLTAWPGGLGPADVRAAMADCGTATPPGNGYYCPGDGVKYVVPEGYETVGDRCPGAACNTTR
jgi:hypothetical protein